MNEDFLSEIQDSFLCEAEDLLVQAETLYLSLEKQGTPTEEVFAQLKRISHNLKGSGKAVGFDGISKLSHLMESLMIHLGNGKSPLSTDAIELLLSANDTLKQDIRSLKLDRKYDLTHPELSSRLENALNLSFTASSEQPTLVEPPFAAPLKKAQGPSTKVKAPGTLDDSIRIPMRKIDDLLNVFGEQVIFLSALDHYKDNLVEHQDEVIRTIFNLKKLAYDLQQSTLTLRMVTLKGLFSKLERGIRDAAQMMHKTIDLNFSGADLELDKAIVDQLSDPLTHMVRNAVDHGIESSSERQTAGKPINGKIFISARREGGLFVIEIRDDGKGLDSERLRSKGIEKGLIDSNQILSEQEIFELIFENGFSTKEQVSELSGRGVGMNVVKEMILSLKGSCEIESTPKQGTCFKIKLPLSLSLFNGMLVRIHGDRYVFPASQVCEIVNILDVETREVSNGTQVVHLRDEIFELIELPRFFKKSGLKEPLAANAKRPQRDMILVYNTGAEKVGFLVHQILSIQRIVQKPLSREMVTCPGSAGVTVLGDGYPAIILDLRQLVETYAPKMQRRKRA